MFDAAAARAMARKSVDLLDFMVAFKGAVVAAAERGEVVAQAALPEAVAEPAGLSRDAADFLLTLFRTTGRPIWAEAVRQAERAGYRLRPLWSSKPGQGGVFALELDWSREAEPPSGGEPLMLLPAATAQAMAQRARAPAIWVERTLGEVRKAAEAGKLSCSLRDPLDPSSPAWAARRERLAQAGFELDLHAGEGFTQVTVRW